MPFILLCMLIAHTADATRLEFVKKVCPIDLSVPHIVERKNAYEDMLALFCDDEILKEFPLRISFSNESAIDGGGVCRDLFSAFWEEAYLKFFDGSSLLSPAMHASVDMSSLPLLGKILSHGFLVCGHIPIRVVFPVLACVLLGPNVDIPQRILAQMFAESLCLHEASIIKEAITVKGMTSFTPKLQASLTNILSRYGCRVSPTPANLKSELWNIAKYELQVKPMAAVYSMRSGIPSNEKPFWDAFSVEQLYAVYLSLSATPEKVLNFIDEPYLENVTQARMFEYLQQYIGDMKSDELRRFLRFTTGSSVIIAEHIKVSFNALTGLA